MKREFSSLSAFALTIGLIAAPAASIADNTASAFTDDGSAVIGSLTARAGLADADGYTKVLGTQLKNSGTPKDLVIGLSFETSLFTLTAVKSKGGNRSEATADAEIEMYVLVDGVMAAPGVITYDKRTQTLWAALGGVLDCADANNDGIITFDECTLSEEEIGLILDTKSAHTFNFLAYNIGSGSHNIEAYARLRHGGEVVEGSGTADANASLGKGTLSVWEVHGSNTD